MFSKKFKNWFYFFTCITPDYMGVDINKEIWKNSHFENMTAGFLQRCQNLLRRFTPEMIHFQAWKKEILNNNNVIDFDPIKIQTCLAPHNDRQHLLFVKDIYVDAKKWPQKVLNGHFWNLNFQIFFLPKLKNTILKTNCDLCCSFWSNKDSDMFSPSKWLSEPKFC